MIAVPGCIVVVATADGLLRRVAETGAVVAPGDVVAVLDGAGAPAALRAPAAGTVGGALADPDQRVSAGEGVLWLAR